eukprot:759818-Hanusia_phi.AAC.4
MFQTSRQFQSSHADKHLSLRTGIGLKLGEVDGNIFVKDIVVGGACFYSEEVNVGDYLMSVDGVDVSKLSKSDIQQLMMGNVGTAVKLGLARRIDNVNVYNFIVEIQRAHPKEPKGSIVKVKGNLGITIQQMPDFTYEIAHIPEDSPLARDDMLRRRDRVWSVNGVNMDQLRCCDAVELFRNPGGGEMKLIVLRKGAVVNVTIDEELFNITAVESRTVLSPVFRSKRLGLSMHVNTDDGSVKIVFVERDGPAGKTRMLQCDDEIVAGGRQVNGYPIAEKTLDKVPKLDDLMLMFETAQECRIDQVTVLTIRRENVAEEFEVAILQSSGQSVRRLLDDEDRKVTFMCVEDKKISSISFPRPPLLRSAGQSLPSLRRPLPLPRPRPRPGHLLPSLLLLVLFLVLVIVLPSPRARARARPLP